MAASTIFFNGTLISRPGSYSTVDARGLEAIGLGASGIVALIGTAQGGKPVTAMSEPNDFIRLTRPGQEQSIFRSGDLYEAVPIAWAPANDEQIQAGAQEILCMKVNPSTQSTVNLANEDGPAVDLTSIDYGAHTEQINVTVGPGTTQGKLLTIAFEDIIEVADDLGGSDLFTVEYLTVTSTYDTMTFQVNSDGSTQAEGTRDELGLDGDIGTQLGVAGTVEVVSTDVGDDTLVTIVGLDAAGDPLQEQLTLTGTTAVVGTTVFTTVLGARLGVAQVGTVTVEPSGGGAAILTFAPASREEGAKIAYGMQISGGLVTLVGDGATVKDVILTGRSATGVDTLEKITLNGTTPVVSTQTYSRLTLIVLGDVEAAVTVTFSATAGATSIAVHDTLQKVADYYNAIDYGPSNKFVFTLVTGNTLYSPAYLDETLPIDCVSPAVPGFTADMWTVIDWVNANSQLVTAAKTTGASNKTLFGTPIKFLSGGIEGVATQTEYQTALNLLKQIRVNTIVPLTHDAAVHAAVDTHCAYMGGAGRNERDAIVGLKNAAGTGLATKTEIKTQIQAINSRHIRAVAQSLTRFNVAGQQTTFDPHFRAVLAAGMQAGSDVGTSLTYKYEDSLAFSQDSSWNPTDDGEELIQAGLMFAESVEGIGRRWVRNITTHLSSSNLAFTEGSVNEAVNYVAYNFRTAMEYAVGRKGFAGTINAAKGIAIGVLDAFIDEEILVQWRSLNIEQVLDVLEIGVEVAPVLPINFVKNTIHLVTIRQAA